MRFHRARGARGAQPVRWASLLAAAVVLIALLAVSPVFSPALGSPLSQKQAELEQAKAELAKLQGSLDKLGDELDAAEVRRAKIDDAVAQAEREITSSKRDYAEVQARLVQRLVNLYKDKDSSAPRYLQVLLTESDLVGVIQRFSLLSKMAEQDKDLYAQVKTHIQKIRQQQVALDQQKKAQAEQIAELRTLESEMNTKLDGASARYRTLKQQVATLKAEAAAAAAAAAAAKEKAAAAAAAAKVAAARAGDIVFPVEGPHVIRDNFGDPRSGGRTHKGDDIMAPKGTPLVAVVQGTILRTNPYDTGLGGITIWLGGANGNNYFYAHLVRIAGGIRAGARVSAGQVIGWVGDTGDADPGAYHLHFEIHPGGGAAIDPYSILKAADG